MTAAELIERLKTLPPESTVLVEGYETGNNDIVELTPEQVVWYRNAQEWDGEYQTLDCFSSTEAERQPVAIIRGRRGHRR